MKEQLQELSGEQRARIEECLAAELARDGDVVFAYLYGSFLEPQPFHDIDVGVYLQGHPSQSQTEKAAALAQQLSNRVRCHVDVRAVNTAPMSFVYHVLQGRLLFSRDDSLLAEVIERTVSRYLDAAPLIRQATREAFAT